MKADWGRRYANRIKNGTFDIGGEEFHVVENEHGGLNTLHGGDIGYDGVSCHSHQPYTHVVVRCMLMR